jgi:hypothetical protein
VKEIPEEVSEYMAKIGAKGGKAKGTKKKRPKAHYKRLGELHKARAAARKAKKGQS